MKPNHVPSSLDADFVNEEDLEAFSDALSYDDQAANGILSGSLSAQASSDDLSASPKLTRVPTIVSHSDWTPIYNRAKAKPKLQKPAPNSDGSSITFTLLHYPILFMTIGWLAVLSIGYIYVRISIWISEQWTIFKDSKRRQLLHSLNNAKSYAEYVQVADELDKYLNFDDWCHEDSHKYYDWKTLRKIVHSLRTLRRERKYKQLAVVLQSCLKSNFAGIENPILYSHCYHGTKDLIALYVKEVTASVEAIISTDTISAEDKRAFFKTVSRNYGRTALVLSGGASFCYNHFGIIKALLENNLMPQIISGTSGGGAIAGLLATRTDEELLELIKPSLARRITLLSGDPIYVWLKRWWKTGARYDALAWARTAQWWTMGSTTFKESHDRTGRMLNISTVPHDIHSPTILCNEITSPNCCIWSSILASAAVPGILQPIVLMQKPPDTNKVEPFAFGNRWRDGSMRTDVPLDALNMYYNVQFSLVSQVNPHVMFWIFKNRGDIGRPIVRNKDKTFRGGFILSYLENLIKLEIIKWLKLIREFQLLPNFAESDWSNLFLQKFGGDITLFPKIYPSDYLHILADPSEDRLARMIRNAEQVTYPVLLFLEHRLSIERAISKGRELTRGAPSVARMEGFEFQPRYSRDETVDPLDTVKGYYGNEEDGAKYAEDSGSERSSSGFLGLKSDLEDSETEPSSLCDKDKKI